MKTFADQFSSADFFSFFRETASGSWADELEEKTRRMLENDNHGDFSAWQRALNQIPELKPSCIDYNLPAIRIGAKSDITAAQRESLLQNLKKLHPWRKGPFDLFGIQIDTEWRSDLKWDRIADVIQPLEGRTVLDLGCGNGYYLWRMAGNGAKCVLGIDSSLLFFTQFQVIQKYAHEKRLMVLPLGLEDLPPMSGFDTVFSMGLLYHRRQPQEHLRECLEFLRPDGELVLETLVIDGRAGDILKPGERYAKMRNVWMIPSALTAEAWLAEAGFRNIRCIGTVTTTVAEQRKTEWMQYESLEDFLNPDDLTKTVEGYAAPKRAIFIAQK